MYIYCGWFFTFEWDMKVSPGALVLYSQWHWLSTKWRQRLTKPTKPLLLPSLMLHFSARCDWRHKDSRRPRSQWRWRRWKHLTEQPQRGAADGEGRGCRGEATGGDDGPSSETSQHSAPAQPASQTAHQTGQLGGWVHQGKTGDAKFPVLTLMSHTDDFSPQVPPQCQWRSPQPPYPEISHFPKTLTAPCWEAGSPHPLGPPTLVHYTHSCPLAV